MTIQSDQNRHPGFLQSGQLTLFSAAIVVLLTFTLFSAAIVVLLTFTWSYAH